MRRARPANPSTRAGNALAKVPAQSWQGRLPVLTPQVQAGSNPAQFDNIGGPGTLVEHVTAYLTPGGSLPAGGGAFTMDREATVPADRAGFSTFAAALAAGPTSVVAIDVTGFAYVYYRRLFDTFRQSGTLEVVITRNGTELVHEVAMGAPATRAFDEPLGRFFVREDDTLEVREPNTSGEAQLLVDDPATAGIIDVDIWALAPPTSRSTAATPGTLAGWDVHVEGSGSEGQAVPPAELQAGDIWLVMAFAAGMSSDIGHPAEFTELGQQFASGNDEGGRVGAWWKIATGSDTAQPFPNVDSAGGVFAYSFAIRGSSVDPVAVTAASSLSDTLAMPSLAIGPSSLALYLFGTHGGAPETLTPGGTQLDSRGASFVSTLFQAEGGEARTATRSTAASYTTGIAVGVG